MDTKFIPGDTVTVLPYSEISEKFINGTILPSGCCFRGDMKQYCDNNYTVKSVIRRKGDIGFYILSTDVEWTFTDEMLSDDLTNCDTDFDSVAISFSKLMGFGQ